MKSINRQSGSRRFGTAVGWTALLLSTSTGMRAQGGVTGHEGHGYGHVQRVRLSGQVRGTWQRQPEVPDAGGTYQLKGNGLVRPLGAVQATSTLHTPGLIAHGTTNGTVTLVTPRGALTVALTGSSQRSFSSVPTKLSFAIQSGTGRYQGSTGSGVVQLALTPQRRPPAPRPGQMSPHFIVAAMFTMKFSSGR